MSADTTGPKVESSTVNADQQPQDNTNKPQFHDKKRGGQRGGRGRGFHNRQAQDFDRKGHFQKGGSGNSSGMKQEVPGFERLMYEKLNELGGGPTFDLPSIETNEKKFSGRNRLYVGNIPNNMDENELRELFGKYGEIDDIFINKEKSFAFLKMDYHYNAEKAKNILNGTNLKNRTLKIRIAPVNMSVKVKNLDEFVTNELLHIAFSVFGDIERCVVITDERGKSIGEGIVEFTRKNSAQLAIRKCSEQCFFLTANVRPVLVEPYEQHDDIDGYSEKFLKRNPDYFKQRNVGPRFASPNSFEEEYGTQWKRLNELYKQKLLALQKENEIEQEKLLAQMEFARFEHETAMLRKQLRERELDMDRQKREWEIREQQAEEQRRRTDEQMRRQEEELQGRILRQEEEIRRRQQENDLFMQAQQLDNMLSNQEENYEAPQDSMVAASMNPEPKPYMGDYGRFKGRDGGPMGRGNRGIWANERDFPNKRRRY